jgi:hypothetical protein
VAFCIGGFFILFTGTQEVGVSHVLAIRVVSGAVLCVAAAGAYAHGPQIQIDVENGQIVTRRLFPDGRYEPADTPIQRVYAMPMAQRALGDANDGWYAQPNAAFPLSGPGIATWQGGFATGSVVSLTFADGLKIWDGAGFVDPGAGQVDVYRGAARTAGAISSDAGPFNAFSFTAIANSDDEHKSAFLRLLGDGVSPNTASDDGVYLVSLRLTTNQAGVAASEPYYLVLNKNGSPAMEAAAVEYVNANIVPEPSVMIVALGGLLAPRRRRSVR